MGILYLELYIRVTVAKISNIHVISMGIHPSQLHVHCWARLEIKLLCGHDWDGFPLRKKAADGEAGARRGCLAAAEARGGSLEGCFRCPLEAVRISQVKERFLGTRNT